jgi:pimeloyl-ACP methyl ester carboxylesterase
MTFFRAVAYHAIQSALVLSLTFAASAALGVEHSPRIEAWKRSGEFIEMNGMEIFVRVEGAGPDLLLLHGYPYSSYDFKEMLPALVKRYRVITFDLPGMGFSDKPEKHTYSFEEYAAATNVVARHFSIQEADVLAHDLGASVAQELLANTAKNDFRLRSIIFMNSGLFSDTYRPRLIQRLLSQSPDWFGSFMSQQIGRASVEKSVLSLFGKDTQPSQAMLDDFWEILNYKNGKAIAYLLGRLVFDKVHYQERWISAMQTARIPLAYFCGPADPNSGRHMADRYRELIPNAYIYLFGDAIGHWPILEAPQAVLDAFGKFHETHTREQIR